MRPAGNTRVTVTAPGTASKTIGVPARAVSCKPPTAVFAPTRPPAALSDRPEYARYEGRPPPCRTAAWIAKPIGRGLQDTA